MKNFIVPEVGNVYKTLYELINLYHSIKQIRSTQEAYQREKTEHLKTCYSKLHEELSKQITRINNFCTPLSYLSEYVANRLEECNQIELIERTHLAPKRAIHELCKKHYPKKNNSAILNKLCENNVSGLYKSFHITTLTDTISVHCVNHIEDVKCFHFTKDYTLNYVSWKLANGKELFKSFN